MLLHYVMLSEDLNLS